MKTILQIIVAAMLCVAAFVLWRGTRAAVPLPVHSVVTDQGVGPGLDTPTCNAQELATIVDAGARIPREENDERTVEGGAVPDDKYGFGFVHTVSENDEGNVLVTLDPALWFTSGLIFSNSSDPRIDGDIKAIAEDGLCNEGESCRGSGFYIRNRTHLTHEYVLDATTKIYVATSYTGETPDPDLCGMALKRLSAEQYAERNKALLKLFPDSMLPAHFDAKNGVISLLVEQYVP